MSGKREQVTTILRTASRGDPRAAAELLPLVYNELRRLARDWIASPSPARLSAGLALGSWIVNTLGHTFGSALSFYINPWPANVWRILIPIIPAEQLFRAVVGTVIGVGVITGLRAIGLVKPEKAGY